MSPFYDPMLGKIVAWGDTREAAIDRLIRATGDIEITGVQTNQALLGSILRNPSFRAAELSTRFLDVHAAHIAPGDPEPSPEDLALLALWCVNAQAGDAAASPWEDRSGWRPGGPAQSRWCFDAGDVLLEALPGGAWLAHAGGQAIELELLCAAADRLRAQIGGRVRSPRVVADGHRLHAFDNGRHVSALRVVTEDALEHLDSDDGGSLVTPLPGTVVAVHVAEGDEVKRGVALVTVEAMKMEHTLTAPHDGRISRVAQRVGDRVSEGAVLIEMSEQPR